MVVAWITSLSLFLLRVGENHPRTRKRPTGQARSPVKASDTLLQHLFSRRLLDNRLSKACRGKQMRTTHRQTTEHISPRMRLGGLLSLGPLHSIVSEGLADW